MSPDRFPERDLRLERLGERDGTRPAHYGETAHVAQFGQSTRQSQAAYEALIDAVFLAPGAGEWLRALGLAVAALVAGKEKEVIPRDTVARDAIRLADPGPGRRA